MRGALIKWISGADALRQAKQLRASELPFAHAYQQDRQDDLYLSLVGELFAMMRHDRARPEEWSLLGNAFAQYASDDRAGELDCLGIDRTDAAVFSSTAFYLGGFPASAYVAMRSQTQSFENEVAEACRELLTRPTSVHSRVARDLRMCLIRGDAESIGSIQKDITTRAQAAILSGPNEWIPLRLMQALLTSFRRTNLRAVLPDGESAFWTPLITSMIQRGIWDFFPSQIDAISRGLLTRDETYALQMPTGAGKTALCEALLFSHLARDSKAAAVFLVPLRSLASELRHTVVRRLNAMGISARCAYGGTVPTGTESRDFDRTRALVATPETLSGILSAAPEFAQRISLVICDEGHLLDAPARGVGLELLLARFLGRGNRPPRFVFISAIVPNIEEMNEWLGGSVDTVVRSDYRPAIGEFAVLESTGSGVNAVCQLDMHPHEPEPIRYRIEGFLSRNDFLFTNPETGRPKTYPFGSHKTRAIAACRKALAMGPAVVFAANKKGQQGVEGLAEELLRQTAARLPLVDPLSYADRAALTRAADYLVREYGAGWIGTRVLRVGAILHHGDIPQETREVLEQLLRDRQCAMAICTNTLAEGVNLPIRTLVLYSVQRLEQGGARSDLLIRDVKNLVGRAGRAGSMTKGLVICANPGQWPQVERVARQATGEAVMGALRTLLERVASELATNSNVRLSNALLERNTVVHSLVDGIDATLVDLAAIEIGEDRFRRMAIALAEQTFANRHATADSQALLRNIIELRAERILGIRGAGRLGWIKATGSRPRMIASVEEELLPAYAHWGEETEHMAPGLRRALLEWAWRQVDVQEAVQRHYRLGPGEGTSAVRGDFLEATSRWIGGASPKKIANRGGFAVGEWLGIYTGVLAYSVQTVVEQGVALLGQLMGSREEILAPAVQAFPDHLRYGVPTNAGLALAAAGVRHRSAYAAIGDVWARVPRTEIELKTLGIAASELLSDSQEQWRRVLGDLVFANTISDLDGIVARSR